MSDISSLQDTSFVLNEIPPERRFLIFDSHLRDRNGHHYEYDKCLLQELKGMDVPCRIYASEKTDPDVLSELQAVPLFSRMVYHAFGWLPPLLSNILDFAALNVLYWDDLRGTRQESFRKGDIILFHTITQNHLFGIYRWYKSIPESGRPLLFLLFREVPHYSYWTEYLHKWPIQCFQRLPGGRVRYLTDSEIVVEEFRKRLGVAVAVVPIPHLPEDTGQVSRVRRGDPLFTYLGPARVEKGFHLLPDAIAILNRQYPDARFAVQSVMHDHRAIKARSELVRKTGHVEVIDHSLASEDYYRLLSDSHCVLLPYDPETYRGRTSGIFAEALAFGKPVITTRDTWMARYVDCYRCGVLMDGYDPEALGKALVEYVGNREFYDRNAREASRPWREYHNPKNYLETVFALAGIGTGNRAIPQIPS